MTSRRAGPSTRGPAPGRRTGIGRDPGCLDPRLSTAMSTWLWRSYSSPRVEYRRVNLAMAVVLKSRGPNRRSVLNIALTLSRWHLLCHGRGARPAPLWGHTRKPLAPKGSQRRGHRSQRGNPEPISPGASSRSEQAFGHYIDVIRGPLLGRLNTRRWPRPKPRVNPA